jgi:hypothetical protein
MSEMSNEAIQASIEARGVREGNLMKTEAGAVVTADVSTPLFVDSAAKVQAGAFPFAVPLFAGNTDTSFAAMSVSGSATGSANDLMHLTLVKGSNATATVAGYYRVTVTDNAGVITTGDYYAPFYTLA